MLTFDWQRVSELPHEEQIHFIIVMMQYVFGITFEESAREQFPEYLRDFIIPCE